MMKRFLLALPVVFAVLLAAWWLWPGAGESPKAGIADERVPAPAEAASPLPQGAEPATPVTDKQLTPPEQEPSKPPSPEQDVMQAQMSDIAAAYRESIRFPAYSKPLTQNDWQMLNPRAFVASEIPIEGVPDLRVSVALAQVVNDIRQPLPVTVTAVSPTPVVAAVNVTLDNAGRTSATLPLQGSPGQAGVQEFAGQLPADMLAAAGPGEVVLRADLSLFSGETVSATTVAELYASAADLLYLGDAYVDGPHLLIPAHFAVFNGGHFRVQANLMDAATGAPVSHINATFVLSEEQPLGLLQVHAETLRAMQAPGPYVLTGINIRRSPSWPGDVSGYGSAQQPTFDVAGFPLAAYSDEPYVDEQAQLRLQFLEQMSGQGGGP